MSGFTMMQLVLRALRKWKPHIERVTFTTVELDGGEQSISLKADWPVSRVGPAGSHTIFFTRERVLGQTAALEPSKQRPTHKICWYRDEAVRELLDVRKGKR